MLSLMTAAMLLGAASMGQAATKNYGPVSYTVLHRYFHNNDAPMPASPLITTREEFDAQFGMATVMGEGGQPTPVNFRKQVVLAIVLPVTEKATTIDSVTVSQTSADELTLAYTVHEGFDNGYSIQPVYLLSIDRRYRNCKVRVVPTVRKEVKVSSDDYQFVSVSDSRHSIRLSVDYPTGGNAPLLKSLRSYLGNRLARLGSFFNLDSGQPSAPFVDTTDGKSFVSSYSRVIADSIEAVDATTAGVSVGRCSLQASLRRVYEDDRVVSYETTGYAYMGGAHGLGFCDGATFDKATGRQLTLVGGSPALLSLVADRLRHNLSLSSDFHFAQEPLPMPKAAPYLDGYGKIKFAYQPYEIGAYALGLPTCEFYPYEIEEWLTSDGKALAR